MLEPFDELMLVDARRGHPMLFFLTCDVEGPLDESRLRQAIVRAAGRHPRFSSRVGRQRGRPVWLPPDVEPQVVCGAVPGIDPFGPIDLARESGLRVVVQASGPQRHSITLVVHHAVCDGLAACEFFGDLWTCYAGGEPRRFSQPADRTTAPAAAEPKLPSVADGLREAWAFVRFRPASLAAVRMTAEGSPTEPGTLPYATIELDERRAACVRQAAAGRGATANDLIVAAAMRAAIAWNDQAGQRRGGVRVTMPVSTRGPRDRLPACNAISYAFLDRTRAECRDRAALVAGLAVASRYIVASGVVAGFLDALRVVARIPGLLTLLTRLPACFSTLTVSNVGDMSRRMRADVPKSGGYDAPGGLAIRRFRGVPPLRPGTRAAVGVLQYAGGMTISCHSSAGADSRTAGRAFLELLDRELDALVAEGGPPTTGVQAGRP